MAHSIENKDIKPKKSFNNIKFMLQKQENH